MRIARAMCLVAATIPIPALIVPLQADPRRDRLSISLVGSVGYASLGQFHDATTSYVDTIESANPGVDFVGIPESHVLWSASGRVRWQFSTRVFAESGLNFHYISGNTIIRTGFQNGSVRFTNRLFEVPLLVGWRALETELIDLNVAIGPTLVLPGKSSWDYSLGNISSFSSSYGGGIEADVSVVYRVLPGMHIEIWAMYRLARTGDMQVSGEQFPPLQELEHMDISGVGGGVGLRVFAW